MGLDLTAFDKVLKDVYLGPIRDQLNMATVLMTRLQKTAEFIDHSGRRVMVPLKKSNSQAIGARADNEDLPDPKKTGYEDSITYIKHNYGTIYVTGPTIRASKDDKGAFIKAVDSEITNMIEGLKKDINRQLIVGDGRGRLAQITAIVGTTLTLANPGSVITTTEATMFVGEDMDVDIYSSDLVTKRGSCTITSVNETANTCVVTAVPPGTVVNDWIVRKDNRDREMMGLRGIVDDGTVLVTLQEIDSAANTWWRAKRLHNNGVLRDITIPILQAGYTAVEKKVGAPTVGITSYAIRDSYANQLQTIRRIVNTMHLDGGFEAVEFNNKPIVPDDQCPVTILYWLYEPNLAIHQQSDFDWAQEDGHILTKVPGKDAYQAFLYYDAQLGTFRRNSHSVIADLQ